MTEQRIMLERCFHGQFRYRWYVPWGLHEDGYATTRSGALRAARKVIAEEQKRRALSPAETREWVDV